MNNTIEILDKDTNTKQTYVLKEEPETTEVDYLRAAFKLFKFIFKSILIAFKFSMYLVISFLELLIKIIKVLFRFNEYKPFRSFTEGKNGILDKIADKNINKYKVKFVADNLSRHEYNFQRTEEFLAQYNYLQQELQKIADNKVLINTEIYRDIFKRISIIIAEAENKALKEGYDYARRTHYQLYDDDIYENFMRDKVMTGQSNTDWGDLKEKGKNEKSN